MKTLLGTRMPLVFVVVAAATAVAVLSRPVHDVDIFWQLKAGELVLDDGRLPDHEPFSAPHVHEPYLPLGWLGQVIYAAAYDLGGWPGLRALDALFWLGGFWLVAAATCRPGDSPVPVCGALALAFLVALPFASLRPQSLAVFALGLLYAIRRAPFGPAATVGLSALTLVAWQNCHPSVITAAVVLAAIAAGDWFRSLVAGERRPRWVSLGLTGLAAAAVVATPLGPELLRTAAENARACREVGVGEWLPPWAGVNRGTAALFWVVVIVTLWLVVRVRLRIELDLLLPAVVLLSMSLVSYRFVLFWAVVMIPVWTRALSKVLPTGFAFERWSVPVPAGVSLILAAALAAAATARSPFVDYLPLDGAAALRRTGVTGTVYCHPAWGGILVFAGHPDWTVTRDGRYYRYAPEEWAESDAAARGEVTLAAIEERHQPVAFFLRPGAEDGLIARVRESGRWVEVHHDPNAVAFIRPAAYTAGVCRLLEAATGLDDKWFESHLVEVAH